MLKTIYDLDGRTISRAFGQAIWMVKCRSSRTNWQQQKGFEFVFTLWNSRPKENPTSSHVFNVFQPA